MARPTRQTVDYFPHFADASERKTLTILEGKFGNSGYAFWFKLLEKLASTPGHFIDCRNGQNWEYLLVKTRTYEEEAREILDMAAKLDAIDKDLWVQKVIWSQNLVNNIADVYRNRKKPLPTKPTLTVTSPFYGLTIPDNSAPTPEPTPKLHPIIPPIVPEPTVQSKVKYSKVKEIKTTTTTNGQEFANFDLAIEVQGYLRKVPEQIDRLAQHEALKNALAELGRGKGYLPKSEVPTNNGRIDLCWYKESELLCAFEIDYHAVKKKSTEKLVSLGAPTSIIVQRQYCVPHLTAELIIIIGIYNSELSADSMVQDPNLAAMGSCYENNINILTPLAADQLKDIAQEYPPGWFEEAVKEAVTANVRNLRYITAILERWKVDGFKVNKKTKKVGGRSGTDKQNFWTPPDKYTEPEDL